MGDWLNAGHISACYLMFMFLVLFCAANHDLPWLPLVNRGAIIVHGHVL